MDLIKKARQLFDIKECIIPEYISTLCPCGGLKVEDNNNLICDSCSMCFPIYLNEKSNDLVESVIKYTPLLHFKELVAQIQAKENQNISTHQLEKIKFEVQKINQLNFYTMRKILRKLNMKALYKNTFYLLQYFGIKIPYFEPDTEKKLIENFILIEVPYTMYKEKKRTSFMNAFFVLKKLCMLIQVDESIIRFIPIRKDLTNLKKDEIIWEKIIAYNNWGQNVN